MTTFAPLPASRQPPWLRQVRLDASGEPIEPDEAAVPC